MQSHFYSRKTEARPAVRSPSAHKTLNLRYTIIKRYFPKNNQ